MTRFIIKLLSINPLLSLTLVLAYIAIIWGTVITLWIKGYTIEAIGIAIAMTYFTRMHSPTIINELKARGKKDD